MNYDKCPECGASALEPDGIIYSVLYCSECDWDIGIKIIEEVIYDLV
jgi:hypothetical protein